MILQTLNSGEISTIRTFDSAAWSLSANFRRWLGALVEAFVLLDDDRSDWCGLLSVSELP